MRHGFPVRSGIAPRDIRIAFAALRWEFQKSANMHISVPIHAIVVPVDATAPGEINLRDLLLLALNDSCDGRSVIKELVRICHTCSLCLHAPGYSVFQLISSFVQRLTSIGLSRDRKTSTALSHRPVLRCPSSAIILPDSGDLRKDSGRNRRPDTPAAAGGGGDDRGSSISPAASLEGGGVYSLPVRETCLCRLPSESSSKSHGAPGSGQADLNAQKSHSAFGMSLMRLFAIHDQFQNCLRNGGRGKKRCLSRRFAPAPNQDVVGVAHGAVALTNERNDRS